MNELIAISKLKRAASLPLIALSFLATAAFDDGGDCSQESQNFRYQVEWSIEVDGEPLSCQEAGAEQVAIAITGRDKEFFVAPCSDLVFEFESFAGDGLSALSYLLDAEGQSIAGTPILSLESRSLDLVFSL